MIASNDQFSTTGFKPGVYAISSDGSMEYLGEIKVDTSYASSIQVSIPVIEFHAMACADDGRSVAIRRERRRRIAEFLASLFPQYPVLVPVSALKPVEGECRQDGDQRFGVDKRESPAPALGCVGAGFLGATESQRTLR